MPRHVVPPPCNPPSLLHGAVTKVVRRGKPRRTAMPLRRAIACLGVAGLVALVSYTSPSLFGQSRAPAGAQFAASYRAPRAADGRPDLNGIWQAFVTANWDLEDHEAQSGPHPELSGAHGAGPAW